MGCLLYRPCSVTWEGKLILGSFILFYTHSSTLYQLMIAAYGRKWFMHQVSSNTLHLEDAAVFDPSMVSIGWQIGEGGQGYIYDYDAKIYIPFCFLPLPVVVKKFKPFVGILQDRFPQKLLSAKCFSACRPFGVVLIENSLCIIMRRYSCDVRAKVDSHEQFVKTWALHHTTCNRFERFAWMRIWRRQTSLWGGSTKRGLNDSTIPYFELSVADFERSGVVGTAFYRAPSSSSIFLPISA